MFIIFFFYVFNSITQELGFTLTEYLKKNEKVH